MGGRIDEKDIEILTILQKNAKATRAAIGREVDLAASAVLGRIRRLEEKGVIRGYRLELDFDALGHPLLAYVFVSEEKPAPAGKTMKDLAALGIADDLDRITGEDCYLLKVRARNTEDLREKLDRISNLTTIRGVRSHLVLQSAYTHKIYP